MFRQIIREGDWRRRMRCVPFLAIACLSSVIQGQSMREETTLQTLLQQGIQQFTEGQYATADKTFQELERIFSEEKEFQADSVQRVILPMRGYSALLAGVPDDAVGYFEKYLQNYAADPKKQAFALFTLAQSHQANGDFPAAIERYREFIREFPDGTEAGIATLRIAELLIEEDRDEEALNVLDTFYQSRQAVTLRQQGRLRALQVAVDEALWERAVPYLLETRWEVSTMPELAVLAFSAMQVGDFLQMEERWNEAVNAYRLVPSRDLLLDRQEARLDETRQRFAQRSKYISTDEAGIWTEYYRGLIQRLEALANELDASEDYTGPLMLRYGEAFSKGDRHYEAWTVFARVSPSELFPEAIREEAHFRWVIEAQTLERWQDTLEIARDFVGKYPESEQAPVVLFLVANAHQQIGEYHLAISILSDLIENYPDHPYLGRWYFTRGFNYLLVEENALAREDFARFIRNWPNEPIATNARLWHALAWFFDKDYDPALEEFDTLTGETPIDHYLRPEMEYRRGAVLYAKRAYEEALSQINHYLESFPEDKNRAEAQVLRGDTLMGLGRLLEAALTFRQVGPEAKALFPYAVFQTGKIYRAMEEYERMAEHFAHYVERTDLEIQPRVSEALYWIGWAREQQGKLAEAFPLFKDAIERFGNDPTATEMQAIFAALHQLHGRLRKNPPPDIDRSDVLLATPEFMDWLGVEAEAAAEAKEWTYYTRLKLYEEDRYRTAKRPETADEILRQVGAEVPIEAMDAEALGTVGLFWLQNEYDAPERFFGALLEHFPQAPQRIYAYYGLGSMAMEEGDLPTARKWLEPIVEETPTHDLGPSASLLYARCLIASEEFDTAQTVLEDVLKLRSARGRPHAEAILLLGESAEAAGNTERAIGYYQRVYNLYRAYPEFVGAAYLRSARLFEARGDLRAAFNTYREVLFFEELTDPDARKEAQKNYNRLEPLVPKETVAKTTEDTPTPNTGAVQ